MAMILQRINKCQYWF
uniref:Uncharacterized protein n=1 Tax=Arundo donax TaxID=35708 RepID=A0A0A9ADR1_ARUDO